MKISLKDMLIANLLVFLVSELLFLLAIIEDEMIFVIFGTVFLLFGIEFFRRLYPYIIVVNRKRNWCVKQLTAEELEMIEDAKALIKSVDENITIANFDVYIVRFLSYGWFHYDKETKELSIFLPNSFRKFGKDFFFMALVHEALHSLNLKNNLWIFDIDFLEGLNQLLTVWLIENYSQKYTIPQKIYIARFKTKKGTEYKLSTGYETYAKEIAMIQSILDKSSIELKEVFLNYIDVNPEFFKKFVPSKHFKKQYINDQKDARS